MHARIDHDGRESQIRATTRADARTANEDKSSRYVLFKPSNLGLRRDALGMLWPCARCRCAGGQPIR